MRFWFIILTIILLLCSFDTQAQHKGWEWAESFGGLDSEVGNDVAFDQFNNVYCVGSFYDELYIGDTVLHTYGWSNVDSYLVKISPKGEILWVRHFHGFQSNGLVYRCHVTTDENNNVYVVGNYTFTLKIADTILESSGNWDVFIAKFDQEGDLLAVSEVKGVHADNCYTDALWYNGLYIGVDQSFHYETNYVTYGSDTIYGNGFFAYSLAKFDADLNFLWLDIGFTDATILKYIDIATDPNGNIYSLATFEEYLVFNNGTIYSEFPNPSIIRKCDSLGNNIWTKQLPDNRIYDFILDNEYNMYCVSTITQYDVIIIDHDTPTTSDISYELILSGYNSELINQWYTTFECDRGVFHRIEITNNFSELITGGSFKYEFTIGDSSFYSDNSISFISRFDTGGNFIDAFTTKGSFSNDLNLISNRDIEVDGCDNIVLTGIFHDTAYFGQDTLTEVDKVDAFVAKYNYNNFKIHLGPDTVVCGNLTISPGESYLNYEWSDGSTLPYLGVTETGSYWVTVINENYCNASDSIFVEVIPLPFVYLGQDTTINLSDTLLLSVFDGYDSYIWQDGSTNPYYEIIGKEFEPGSYLFWVRSGQEGCTYTDSIYVTIIDDSGTHELESLYNVRLYPNPTCNELYIYMMSPFYGNLDIYIIDEYGRLLNIISVQNENQRITIPMEAYESGLYTIKMLFDDSVITRKMIIIK